MKNENNTVSLLEIEEKRRFRTVFLETGSVAQACRELGINPNTFDSWYYRNQHGVRDFIKEIKRELFIIKTEKLSNEILDMKTYDNAKLLAIKQKEAEFVRETLLKDEGYTKRTETIGINVNKTEPLDEEQKKKLDDIINGTRKPVDSQ
jgi:transposase-like protein